MRFLTADAVIFLLYNMVAVLAHIHFIPLK